MQRPREVGGAGKASLEDAQERTREQCRWNVHVRRWGVPPGNAISATDHAPACVRRGLREADALMREIDVTLPQAPDKYRSVRLDKVRTPTCRDASDNVDSGHVFSYAK